MQEAGERHQAWRGVCVGLRVYEGGGVGGRDVRLVCWLLLLLLPVLRGSGGMAALQPAPTHPLTTAT